MSGTQYEYEVTIWRPNGKNTGAAAILQYKPGSDAVWLSMAPQNASGEGFDFKSKISTKLNVFEMGQILAVVENNIPGLGEKQNSGYYSGLVHQIKGQTDSTIIGLAPAKDKENEITRFLSVSATRGEDKNRYSVGLGIGEQMAIRAFCQTVMPMMLAKEPYNGGGGTTSASSGSSNAAPARKTSAPATASKPAPAKRTQSRPVEPTEDEGDPI